MQVIQILNWGVLQANSVEPAQSFRQLETETYAASTKKNL
jgi:hypothetical protein